MGRVLLLVAGTLAGLLLAEAAVRLLGFGPPAAPRRVVYAGQSKEWCCGPRLEVGGVPRYEAGSQFAHCYDGVSGGHFDARGCIDYRINDLGYRGARFLREKPVGVYRVVLLGDSFTFGEGTPEPWIYPTLLREALDARGVEGRQVEVVNLGIPGNDLTESRLTYQRFGRRLQPDLVALQWNTNDFPAPQVQEDHLRLIGARYRELYARAETLGWSHLLSFVYMRLQMSQLSRELIATTQGEAEAGRYRLGEIGRVSRMAEQDGAGFLVLAFPELIRFDDYPYAAILDLLREYCRSEGIALVDLLPALSVHEDRELWVHETDHHPNRIAHAIAARELAKGLDPLLPPPARGSRD
jgi:lysophospholipase L1-like esterase